jgi:hypothetical protein
LLIESLIVKIIYRLFAPLQCHWDEVPFITPDSASYLCAESDAVREPTIKAKLDEFVRERKYEARLLFLLSKTYLMVQNRPAAAGCLRLP